MAIQNPTSETYSCPECSATMTAETGSWSCTECNHVPHHSAD